MFKKMVYTLVLSLYSLTKCSAEPDNNPWLNPDAVHSIHSGYIEGYENFIFAVPDKNISGDEAKSHRLDPNRKHQKLKDLKKGKIKKTVVTEDNCAFRFMTKRGCEESAFGEYFLD